RSSDLEGPKVTRAIRNRQKFTKFQEHLEFKLRLVKCACKVEQGDADTQQTTDEDAGDEQVDQPIGSAADPIWL
ncbi:MAG: hypothetical protein AB8G22_21385, partial [Saprospiraceae bacterium]